MIAISGEGAHKKSVAPAEVPADARSRPALRRPDRDFGVAVGRQRREIEVESAETGRHGCCFGAAEC